MVSDKRCQCKYLPNGASISSLDFFVHLVFKLLEIVYFLSSNADQDKK